MSASPDTKPVRVVTDLADDLPFMISRKVREFLVKKEVSLEGEEAGTVYFLMKDAVRVMGAPDSRKTYHAIRYNIVLRFNDDESILTDIEVFNKRYDPREVKPFLEFQGGLLQISDHAIQRLFQRGIVTRTKLGARDFFQNALKDSFEVTELKSIVKEDDKDYRFFLSKKFNSIVVTNRELSYLVSFYPYEKSIFDTKEIKNLLAA